MGKRILLALMALIFVFTSAEIGFAAEKGNERKGKYIYRKVYKSCYKRGEVDSAKPPLDPNSKTQAQWNEIFDKNKSEEFGCKEEWDKLSEEDLRDIFSYLHGHASDSGNPVTCK
ncbi:MAG: cytochrome c family protein [Desulfobacteraceae bacterium]|nr:cytochrome c family protein [Desulfobacteraceae bacterium]